MASLVASTELHPWAMLANGPLHNAALHVSHAGKVSVEDLSQSLPFDYLVEMGNFGMIPPTLLSPKDAVLRFCVNQRTVEIKQRGFIN